MRTMLSRLLLVVGTTALACNGGGGGGGSGSGGAGGSGGFSCVPPNARDTPACTSCVETNCADEYRNLCAANCPATGSGVQPSAACQDALDAIGTCIDDKCPGCDPGEPEAGGTGGVGGTSGAGGTSSAGVGGAGSGSACVLTGAEEICNWYPSSADPASAVQSACTTGGGAFTDHCPPDGLFGCCVQTTGTVCYYPPDVKNPLTMSLVTACGRGGGMWTTTPP